MRPGRASNGPFSRIAEDRDRVARVRVDERQRRRGQPRHAQDRDVLLAVDDERLRRQAVDVGCPRAPATTCAAVTTTCGRATQPEPSTPRPHAVAVIRTTLGRARVTTADASARVSGGGDGGAGPAIAGTGRRARARAAPCAAARSRSAAAGSVDCCTSARSVGLAGQLEQRRRRRPRRGRARAPRRRRGRRSSRAACSGGITASPPRANEPAMRGDRLEHGGADQRADEPGERRVGRAGAAVRGSAARAGRRRSPRPPAPRARARSRPARAGARRAQRARRSRARSSRRASPGPFYRESADPCRYTAPRSGA